MIYLDYSATTPVESCVLDNYVDVSLNYIGNSNSLHSLGIKSKILEDKCTSNIASLLGVKENDIIYTSGASESNNMAIKGVCLKYQNRGKHIITSPFEHSSIVAPLNYLSNMGFDVDIVNLNDDGSVDVNHLKSLMRDDTILVTITFVDSELGIVNDIKKIADIVDTYPKCFFHVDATQAIGKVELDINNIDLVSLSAHKFYAPKGIGLLIKKEKIVIDPLIHGGKSTTIYRSGTPALPLISAMTKALELIIPNIKSNYNYVLELNNEVRQFLSKYEKVHINSTTKSLPHILNFSIIGVKPETFLHALEEYDIFISTKSACSSTDTMSSSVYAVTKDKEASSSSLRISLSYLTTKEELNEFYKAFDICYQKLTNLR